jgi:hypothetical protein
LWLSFLDTFGAPLIVGNVPSYEDFTQAMIKQHVRSAVGYQGTPGDKISVIQPSTPAEFERLENALISRVERLILGQNLTSNISGSSGSRAAAQVHDLVRKDKRNADVRMVTPTAQRWIDSLCRLNNFAPHTFVMGDDTGLELDRAQRDATLLPVLEAAGFKLVREYFTDRYDLKDKDLADAPVLDTTQGTEPLPKPPSSPALSQNLAAWDSLTLEAIRSAVTTARDPSDLDERLQVLFDTKPAEFAAVKTVAHTAANVLGFLHE